MHRRDFLAWLALTGLTGAVRAQPDFRAVSEALCGLSLEGQPWERVRQALGWTLSTSEREVLLAWYTGRVGSESVVAAPLAWKACGFALPPGECGPAWWRAPDE